MSKSDLTPTAEDIELLHETQAAAREGDLRKAFFLAGGALHLGLAHPLFYKLRGLEHEQSGRPVEAEADFRAALAGAPNDFAVLDMLGLALSQQGRMAEALTAFDSALRVRPDYAPALVNRALVLENLGDLPGARAAYRRAADIDPSAVRAQAGLAVLAARAGQWGEAKSAAREALKIANGDSGARLALAMAALGEDQPVAAEREARGLLAEPDLPAQERGVALTLVGDALDRQDRADEAFEAYAQANATLKALYGPRFAPGGAPTGLAVAERLRRAFAATKPADWTPPPAPGASPAQGHAFVLGFPRSGTTLLGQVLAAHPQVTTLDELETLGEAGVAFLSDEDGLERLARTPSVDLAPFREGYWRRMEGLARPALAGRMLVDKLPMNTLGLPLIARLFPEAKVIFVRRDPRDVVLSCFRRQFVMNGATWELLSLESAARFYAAVMELAQAYMAALPLDLQVLRYEDLVADFAGQTEQLSGFLGLPADPAMMNFKGSARPEEIATPSAAQVAGGLSDEGVGQWRRYETHLAPVLPILQPWIEAFGY